MSRSILILCAIFTCISFATSISKNNDIKMVVDVLESFHRPSDVIANLCWSNPAKKKLMKSLSESKSPRSIKFVNDIHSKDLLNKEKTIFLLDIACEESIEFLNKASSGKYFGKPYRWFVINRRNAEAEVPIEMDKMDILPDSEVFVMQHENNRYNINLVHKIKPKRNWQIENYGHWSSDSGLTMSRRVMELTLPIRRKNLAQESIVTSMVIADNHTLEDLEQLRYKEADAVAKGSYHQMTSLFEFLNATRKLIFAHAWGYRVNGSYTGMLGHMAEAKAELAGIVMFITKERLALVEYLTYPTATAVKFIFREPPLSYQNNLYLLPFKASVWYCLGVFVVVLIVVMYISAYWEGRKDAGDQVAEDRSTLIPKVSDVTVFVMSAISQQGSDVELKGGLGRFVIFLIFLVFLFLYTAYSASIVVLLQASSNQIRTLNDLYQSKLELGVENTTYNRYWFSTQTEPLRKAIYEKKIAPSGSKPQYFDLVEGIKQLQKKPFAFNCNVGVGYRVIERYFYEHEKCGLQEISYIQDDKPWQACRKGSPYREIFKIGLLRNVEHGLNDRTNKIIFAKKPACTVRGGSFVSVAIVDCYPILLLLLYGMILGVVLLLAEILHHRKTGKMRVDSKIQDRTAVWSAVSGVSKELTLGVPSCPGSITFS